MEREQTSREPGVIPIDAEYELRPVMEADAEVWYAAADRNRARLQTWLPWARPEFSRADMRRFLTEKAQENAARVSLTLGIWRGTVLCGSIGLHKIDRWHRSSSIGYWLDGAHQGRGIMTQACRAVVGEGFRNYGLHRIEIRCAVGNERSCAIPRRLNFQEEGILRETEWLGDRWADLRVFSMLEQYWY